MEKLNKGIQLSKDKLKALSLRKLAPNVVTMLALCAGLTSIRYSLQENWERAIICIFLAGILDMIDGRVARMLKASSKFGAELDSLSDFACFGVAPAFFRWPASAWLVCFSVVSS